MVETIRARSENRTGRLTVACVPSIATTVLPAVVEAQLAERPGFAIELLDVDTASVARLVDSGEVDLGVAGRPPKRIALGFTPLFADRFRVICRADDPLREGPVPVPWSALKGRRLIRSGVTDAVSDPQWRALSGTVAVRARNVSTLLAMVGAGVGLTLLPALATVQLPPDLVALPLAAEHVQREVGVLERPGVPRAPVAEAFLARLRAEIPRWAEALVRQGSLVMLEEATTSRTLGGRR